MEFVPRKTMRALFASGSVLLFLFLWAVTLPTHATPQNAPPDNAPILRGETSEQADRQSTGCLTCHTATDSPTMHPTGTIQLGCVDCHGGNPSIAVGPGTAMAIAAYEDAKRKAHPQPRIKRDASTSANPVRAYTRWLSESPEYIQFVNPGDLRVAARTCGTSGCHAPELRAVRTSMMTHGAMLWGAALYNNGAYPEKNPHFGESYGIDGKPQRLRTWPPPSAEETRTKGVLPFLDPLERWEISQPGNVLRVFERGSLAKGEIGVPEPNDAPGHPENKLSTRGFGTELRTDPVFLGLQKTRLLDPLLSFPGTNEQPGDYRGSGCTGCHVVYANDRSADHSGHYAPFGNEGKTSTADPTIPKNETGHPIQHVFTRAIPSSQCMVCHMHPGTNMVTTYFGYTWWDNETDGAKMYPAKQKNPTEQDLYDARIRNPEGSAPRGNWSDVDFLKKVGTAEFNKDLKHTQFADFHSHGWIFRAVFKRDRKGNLLDENGEIVDPNDPEKFKKAVQLKDIHMEKGMHCVDCHFVGDAHGNGKLYGETRNAVEVTCENCHGNVQQKATLLTNGPAAENGGRRMELLRTPWQEQRFYWKEGRLFQRSAVDREKEWEVVQVQDSVTPGNPHFSEKSRAAKLITKGGGMMEVQKVALRADAMGVMKPSTELMNLAHSDTRMTCASCHTSWTPSCFGCHLSMTANQRMPMLHNEGLLTRNWTAYNFMVLRDDVYMLGIDGTPTGNRISPVRSACAVVVSSQNGERDWLYYGQQTISAEGYSGQAFSTFVPHTVRSTETKTCTDCHVSKSGNNNAWLAQVMIEGTNFLNYMGRYIYVANGKEGFEAVSIAEHDEPPAILGSDLHKLAYPDNFRKFQQRKMQLKEAYHQEGSEILDLQLRGEYLYTAMGKGGLRVYDVANIDNKDFSERMVTAPVSPLGQRLYVKTKYATAVASPSTLAVDPLRKRLKENEEQPISLLYGFLYVTDKYEGLVVVGNPPDAKRPQQPAGVGTLLDGDPKNNFLHRAVTFNPDGVLNGARRIAMAGSFAYILCDRGLVTVDLSNPLGPKVVSQIPELKEARGISIQFRYAFVVDREGLKVVDITHLDHPRLVEGALVPVEDARNVYVARTYAYVSGGKQGMVIIDVEKPEQPKLEQVFNAGGKLNDTNDIKIGMTNASQFAYVADGENGVKVVQLFSPDDTPQFYGFSPKPTPKLIAERRTKGPALAISKGMDRDRAVDETGNQVAVFGRRGARPFNLEEMQRMYLRNGELYSVIDPGGSSAQSASGLVSFPGSNAASPQKTSLLPDLPKP